MNINLVLLTNRRFWKDTSFMVLELTSGFLQAITIKTLNNYFIVIENVTPQLTKKILI